MVRHSDSGLSDAVRRHCEAGALNFSGMRHEGAASFAAPAFAKRTPRPYNHFLRLNQKSMKPKIASSTAHNNGYDHFHLSSGIYSKFMP